MSRRAMLQAGLRRLALMLVALAAATAVVSVLGGLLLDVRLSRALSVGFYAIGSFGLVAGFFVGNRGPARGRGPSSGFLFGRRELRWASPDEQEEAISNSVLFVTIGLVLVVIGVLIDPRTRVV